MKKQTSASNHITLTPVLNADNFAEFRGEIIDTLEDFCDSNGISIRNLEKEEYDREAGYAPGENGAIIFGDDYDLIVDEATFEMDWENPKPLPDSLIKRNAENALNTFNSILQKRGTRELTSAETEKLSAGIYAVFKSWDAIIEQSSTMIAFNIKWDTDGVPPEELNLPRSVEIPAEVASSGDDDTISDWLSAEYGFCHFGFSLSTDSSTTKTKPVKTTQK